MASIVIQRITNKTGVSYAVKYNDPETGKKKHYRTYRRKKDAEHARNELRILLDNGELPQQRRKIVPLRFSDVVSQLVQDWEVKLSVGELRQKTYDDYVITARSLERTFGKMLTCEINASRINEFRLDKAKSHSNVTSNRMLFVLKQILQKGIELGALKTSPAEGMKYLSEKQHKRNRFLMPHEVDALLEAARQGRAKHYLPALVCLGAEHGASKQECLSLTWADIAFDYQGHGMIRFFRAKNQLERTEFLMPRTKRELLRWRDHLQKGRERYGLPPLTKSDRVFCRFAGRPIQEFKKSFHRACKNAGIHDFRFHDLRHTFCSNLILAGADLKDAKEMIGHADIGMTDRYSHLTAQHKLLMQRQLTEHYQDTNEEG